MANWFDVASLVVVAGMFGGAIYVAIMLNKQFSNTVESTKDGLKKRGLDITENGMSVKTEGRLDHSDYVAATQKNMIEAIKAASYGSPQNQKAAVPETITEGYAAPGTRHRASLSKKK